jgi:hypothetical protein
MNPLRWVRSLYFCLVRATPSISVLRCPRPIEWFPGLAAPNGIRRRQPASVNDASFNAIPG